jgi:hypothetical protein
MCHDVGVMFPNTPMAFLPSIAAKTFFKAASLTVVAASGMVLANPGAANAAACDVTSYTISQLTARGFSCTIADKTFSDFAFNGLTTGNFSFTFDDPQLGGTGDHTFSGSGLNYRGNGFDYEYKVTITGSNLKFSSFNTGFSGSSTSAGAASYSKKLSAYKADGTTLIGDTFLNPGPGTAGGYTFVPKEAGPIVFKSVVTKNTGTGNPRIDTITDSITQTKNTPFGNPTVPGPLPLLGAGAAFGMSRKLRRRISFA